MKFLSPTIQSCQSTEQSVKPDNLSIYLLTHAISADQRVNFLKILTIRTRNN